MTENDAGLETSGEGSAAAKELSKLGASKGGAARALILSPERRREIARKAVLARWERQGNVTRIAQATHGSPENPLVIAGIQIPCYVLADGRRVLTQKGMIGALGMSFGGSSHGQDRIAKFASQDRLKPLAAKHITSGTLHQIEFYTPQGHRIFGYEATLLVDMCDAVLEARKAGALTKKQEHVATRCEILVRGLSRVGIIALVDEATGHQADRARDALARILETFISKELRGWVKTFSLDYFKHLCRLRNWAFSPQMKLPPYSGKLTNDIVYSRLAPGVLAELRRRNPVTETGRRKHKHFQWLTENAGYRALKEHLAAVEALMKVARNWDNFYDMIEKALPVFTPMPLFDVRSAEQEVKDLSNVTQA